MMSLRHFLIFKTAAQTGNFTKTAKELYITQSAVSHTIRELEDYTGALLFDRSAKQVRLTSAGTRLLEEILPILSACEALDKRITHLEKQAPVHVVSSITIAAFWLPKILKQFEKTFQEVPVYVQVVTAAEAMKVLGAGEADLAFVEGARPAGMFETEIFAEYSLEIVASPEYNAVSNPMSISEFCGQRLLLREKGSAIRDTLDSELYLKGQKVHPLWTSVNSTALIQAAKAGLGITVLPRILVYEEIKQGELVSLEVENLDLKNELLAVKHKDKKMTPALEHLLGCVTNLNVE